MTSKISSVLNRQMVFVHGKGGVGKTVVSQSLAQVFSERGLKTLWVTIEDPTRPPGELVQSSPNLWNLNCDFTLAFEEYASLKIGAAPLTRLFLQNKLVRYLSKAAPGIHELVLLGKIWFERLHYDHVIVDLPSTGYGLAMFQSTANFIKLFHGGPLHRDAESMLETFKNPQATGHVILALPEEMPLQEALELDEYLGKIFPDNPSVFLVNRTFPGASTQEDPPRSPSPLASSVEDYVRRRLWLENHNLRLWREAKIQFGNLEFVPPPLAESPQKIVLGLAGQLKEKGYL